MKCLAESWQVFWCAPHTEQTTSESRYTCSLVKVKWVACIKKDRVYEFTYEFRLILSLLLCFGFLYSLHFFLSACAINQQDAKPLDCLCAWICSTVHPSVLEPALENIPGEQNIYILCLLWYEHWITWNQMLSRRHLTFLSLNFIKMTMNFVQVTDNHVNMVQAMSILVTNLLKTNDV